MKKLLFIPLLLLLVIPVMSGCHMGRGAFAALNPVTWLKPSTYIEMHRQHKAQEIYEESQKTNHTVKPISQ